MALVNRDDKVAFMEVGESNSKKLQRMTNFTSFSQSKNPTEYSRRYVDKHADDVDVTGYSPSIAYAFDQYSDNEVHKSIAEVHDDELIGTATIRTVVVVNRSAPGTTDGTFEAIQRTFSVIPDADGDSTDAYTYSGTLRAKGDIVKGTATTTDGWKTCTFTAATD